VTPGPIEFGSGARLSHDGKRIVFTQDGTIWIENADGSSPIKIFEDPEQRLAIVPTWSPDGQYIIFGLDPPNTNPTLSAAPPNGLYIINADGSGLTPIVSTRDWKRDPDWSAAE
jgi:hypothetical protein